MAKKRVLRNRSALRAAKNKKARISKMPQACFRLIRIYCMRWRSLGREAAQNGDARKAAAKTPLSAFRFGAEAKTRAASAGSAAETARGYALDGVLVEFFLEDPLVFRENGFLDLVSGFRNEGMRDIPEVPLAHLSARHSDEQPVLPVDDLYIMHHKFIVECYGNHGFHLSFIADLANSDISNSHTKTTLSAA
jgi:hypothetical protein